MLSIQELQSILEPCILMTSVGREEFGFSDHINIPCLGNKVSTLIEIATKFVISKVL